MSKPKSDSDLQPQAKAETQAGTSTALPKGHHAVTLTARLTSAAAVPSLKGVEYVFHVRGAVTGSLKFVAPDGPQPSWKPGQDFEISVARIG